MGGKIFFCLGVIACVILAYVIMTAYWPAVTEMTNYAANMTDPTRYPEAHAAAASAPIWLYFIPAIVGVVAIVIKLRQPEQP